MQQETKIQTIGGNNKNKINGLNPEFQNGPYRLKNIYQKFSKKQFVANKTLTHFCQSSYMHNLLFS